MARAQCPRAVCAGKIARGVNASRHLSANDFAHPTSSNTSNVRLAKAVGRTHISTHKRVLLADFIFVTPAHTKPSLPSKDDLLVFIGQQSGKIGTREIARAFGLKNADRATLKRMLRELADEGRIERRRKKLHHPGTLPPVVLTDITARDLAGADLAGLLADEDEEVVFGGKGRFGMGRCHENKIRE